MQRYENTHIPFHTSSTFVYTQRSYLQFLKRKIASPYNQKFYLVPSESVIFEKDSNVEMYVNHLYIIYYIAICMSFAYAMY